MRESHYLYLKIGAVLLADVSENLRKMCIEFCQLDLPKFLSTPELVSQATLKKGKVKLE